MINKICDKMNIDNTLSMNSRIELAIKLDPFTFFKLCEDTNKMTYLFDHTQSVLIQSHFLKHFNDSHIPLIQTILKSSSYKCYHQKFELFSVFLKYELPKDTFDFLVLTYINFFFIHYEQRTNYLKEHLSQLNYDFQKRIIDNIKVNKSNQFSEIIDLFTNLYNF